MPIAATGFSCRDQDHRRALQSLLSGKLPRADRHHLGLRWRLDAVLSDGRAAARRVDEAASGRAPCGMALRDRQTRWQGSLGGKQLSSREFADNLNNSYSTMVGRCPAMLMSETGQARKCWWFHARSASAQ